MEEGWRDGPRDEGLPRREGEEEEGVEVGMGIARHLGSHLATHFLIVTLNHCSHIILSVPSLSPILDLQRVKRTHDNKVYTFPLHA